MGKSKANVAAARVMNRVQGVTVTPHFCRIEEKPLDFYEQFHVIVLGLDSLEARRYMNQVACSFLGTTLCSTSYGKVDREILLLQILQAEPLSITKKRATFTFSICLKWARRWRRGLKL